MFTRRELLKVGAIAGGASLLNSSRAITLLSEFAQVEAFSVPLPIPPVLKPVRRKGGRDYYEITMRQTNVGILPGKRTRVWVYNGHFPGPTIKVRRGRPVVVRQINKLKVDTTIHLHGGHVSPANDGHPMDLIAPGKHKDYHYPNKQLSSTLWYHDHTHHHTSRNVYMGLAGLYLIEDEAENELNLPKGKYDIPLMIQDRSFKSDGSLKFDNDHTNVLGDTFLVNGKPLPYLKVANRKYRFRILNASNSRGYTLALDSLRPFSQIASDGGLLAAPVMAPTIPLWPAERAEVVIDFSAYQVGTSVVLQDLIDPPNPLEARPIMRFDIAREESDPSSLPSTLRTIDAVGEGTKEREFQLSLDPETTKWVINGKSFGHHRIDARPKLGDTETWVFNNLSDQTHPMHVHLVMFQIIDRDGVPPSAGEAGWKDTVRVDSGEVVRVAMKFADHTGRYVFHCHNLAHEDHDMMAQMKVVR